MQEMASEPVPYHFSAERLGFIYDKGLNDIQEESVFNKKLGTRTRKDNLKLIVAKIRSNVKKYYFTERPAEAWKKNFQQM